MKDNVNHPSHYTTGKIEVIDFIEDNLQDGFEYYLAGNILKYICRYKHKNRVEDLKKASWYLDKLVKIKEEQKWVGKEIKKDTNDNKEKQ